MRQRHRPTLRLLTWLAFVAMGLASFTPVVSQVKMAHAMAGGMSNMDAMADMPADCMGHMEHASPAIAPGHDTGHGGMPMEACGYCSFLAHHPGLPAVPVVLMRAPALVAEATPSALPTRPQLTPWFFDAAPRGPPVLT